MKQEEGTNRRPWQRMALSLFGVVIISAMWRWATGHLYVLPEHSIAAFTSLTTNAFYTISAITIFMVTGKLVYDWKNRTETVTQVLSATGRALDPKDFDGSDVS